MTVLDIPIERFTFAPVSLQSGKRRPVRVFLLGGSHPRHLYYLNRIANSSRVNIVGALLEERGTMFPEPPDWLDEHDAELWMRHFNARAEAERRYFSHFGKLPWGAKVVSNAELNTPESAQMVKEVGADLALIFGCGMIREPLMSALPGTRINLHLGLSPRYRGAATLFWPFYMLEPNWAGATFHQIVDEPDAGEILHQSRPLLLAGDTIHDVACRAVVQATEDMLALLDRWPYWTFKQQRNTGKCFLARDFQAQHLRPIYDEWDDKIVDAYLEGRIRPSEPVLYQENLK